MPKKTKLAVLLGAGASHSINRKRRQPDEQNLRPPLVGELFADTATYARILDGYPSAKVLSSTIRNRLRREGGVTLEDILREFAARATAGEDSPVTRQFLELPLYLNELFGAISSGFTTSPEEYNVLVNSCLEAASEVLFITTNYDTILEQPLSGVFKRNFSQLGHYLDHPNWTLAKLHGSINWYRAVPALASKAAGDRLTAFAEADIPIIPSDDIIMRPIPGDREWVIGGQVVYPAMTVPVAGKYEFNCPPEMVAACRAFLSDCPSLLVVGFSCKDTDVLSLLGGTTTIRHILIVDRSQDTAREAGFRLQAGGNGNLPSWHPYGKDFQYLVDSGDLDKFLASLPPS